MLSGLILENFKAFQDRQVIPFAPITLIFGANSAGKSSVLQSLLLLKQFLSGDESIREMRLNGRYVKFGEYSEMAFGGDISIPIEITPLVKTPVSYVSREERLSLNLDELDSNEIELGLGYKLTFRRPTLTSRTTLVVPHIASIQFYLNDSHEPKFVKNPQINDYTEGDAHWSLIEKAYGRIYTNLKFLYYIPAIRNRIGRYIPLDPDSLDSYGEVYELVLKSGAVGEIQGAMNQMGIKYKLQEQRFDPKKDKLVEIELMDTYTNTLLYANNVGVGVGQVLPILILCASGREEVAMIEQPELHLHPKQQAELGSLFVQSYSKHGNQFIIETHSEHLIRRIQKLIRQGVLNPNNPDRITCEDVCILYISRDKGGSHVKQMDLDELGNFKEPWPDDFFDLSFNEAFDGYFEALGKGVDE